MTEAYETVSPNDFENSGVTWRQVAMLGGGGTVLVALAFWVGSLASHIGEHDSKLREHQDAIVALQKSHEEMMKAVGANLATIATDNAVVKEKLATQGETLAEIKGSLRPAGAISLQQQPSPLPTVRTRQPIGSFR